jgi:dephospho-CoA kinase
MGSAEPRKNPKLPSTTGHDLMTVIGVIGGIASGKSVVSEYLRKLGATVLDVDHFGHEVLRQPEVREAAVKQWGPQILNPAGEIDRRTLAGIVFNPENPRELEFLENLTFPDITTRIQTKLTECAGAGTRALILDAAVMMKAGWDDFCDVILYVSAERNLRLQRSRERGWTETQFAAREAAQLPVEQKRGRANIIINNNGTIDQTYRQIREFWQSLDKFLPDAS